MRLTTIGVLLSLSTLGCKGPKKFDKQNATTRCALYKDCEVLDLYGYASKQECEQALSGTYTDCDDYDRKAAKSCIEALEGMECEALQEDRLPSACSHACPEVES